MVKPQHAYEHMSVNHTDLIKLHGHVSECYSGSKDHGIEKDEGGAAVQYILPLFAWVSGFTCFPTLSKIC